MSDDSSSYEDESDSEDEDARDKERLACLSKGKRPMHPRSNKKKKKTSKTSEGNKEDSIQGEILTVRMNDEEYPLPTLSFVDRRSKDKTLWKRKTWVLLRGIERILFDVEPGMRSTGRLVQFLSKGMYRDEILVVEKARVEDGTLTQLELNVILNTMRINYIEPEGRPRVHRASVLPADQVIQALMEYGHISKVDPFIQAMHHLLPKTKMEDMPDEKKKMSDKIFQHVAQETKQEILDFLRDNYGLEFENEKEALWTFDKEKNKKVKGLLVDAVKSILKDKLAQPIVEKKLIEFLDL